MKIKFKTSVIWILFLLTVSMPFTALADDGGNREAARSAYMERRRELMELKEKDPEAFKAKVTELRNSAQKRLDELKEKDPETYQRVLERRQKRMKPRFEHLREENPEAFERMQQHRESLIEKRRNWMREHDPESFQQIELRRSHAEYRFSGPANPDLQQPRMIRQEFRQEIYRPGPRPEDRPRPRRDGPRRQQDGR